MHGVSEAGNLNYEELKASKYNSILRSDGNRAICLHSNGVCGWLRP